MAQPTKSRKDTMANNFYPQGYEIKETSDYMRLAPGENKVRILTKPIIGYETWEDYIEDGKEKQRPNREKTFQKAVSLPSRDGKIKEFHAFIVWDYKENMVRLLNITQKSIQKAIYTQTLDEDWTDPTAYDIVILKTGTGMETEYSVVFKLPKPMDKSISDAFKAVKIVPENYFTGGHPIVRNEAETITENEDIAQDALEALSAEKLEDGDVPF